MKLKENLILRQVAGTWIVLPVGEATAKFNGMLSLNETGAMLWKLLEDGADKQQLLDALTKEYNVSSETASQDIEEFLTKLNNAGCLDTM